MTLEIEAQTIAQFTAYLDELSLQDITPEHRKQSRQRLGAFRSFLDGQPPSAYLAKKFLAELRERGYKQRSVEAYYHAIKPFLEFNGIPFKLKLRRPHDLPHYHSPDQLNSMLDIIANRSDRWAKVKTRDTLIILMIALTGLRKSELLALRPMDISDHFIYVRQGKGGKDRAIPPSHQLIKPLKDYIAQENISPTDRLISIKSKELYNIVVKYARAAGIDDLSPHGLRHFFATSLVERGAHLTAVQQLLGHTNIQTTSIYIDVIPQHLADSIALLDQTPLQRESSKEKQQSRSISKSKSKSVSKSLSLSLSSKTTKCSERERKNTLCGSSSKKVRPYLPLSTSVPLKALRNIGQGSEVSYAWGRDAPIASRASPEDGDTRPGSLLTARPEAGSLERR